MRKFFTLLTAALAVMAVAALPAMAQDLPDTSVDITGKVTPKKAGTKKNPQGVKISGKGKWTTEAGFEPPVIAAATAYIGKGGNYNAGKYAKCSVKALRRDGGPKNCPKKSIMGSATGVALADNVKTSPKVVVVNGGQKKMFFYTTLYFPALVQEPIVLNVKKVSGKWAYKTTLKVPENLKIVAGVPIALQSFKFNIGGKPYAKNLFETTSCPKGGYSFQVETFYEFNDGSKTSSKDADRVPCT
jgi:hypothetical protein